MQDPGVAGRIGDGIGGGGGIHGGTMTISNASVNASIFGTITNGTQNVYSVTVQNLPVNAVVTFQINGGNAIPSTTDSTGRLYLWLPVIPQGSPAGIAVTDTATNKVYTASVVIVAGSTNAVTASELIPPAPAPAPTPEPVTIAGTLQSDGSYSAAIPINDTMSQYVYTATVNLGGNTLVFPVSVLSGAVGSGSALTLTQSTPSADEGSLIAAAAGQVNFPPLLAFEFNLARTNTDGSKTPVHTPSDGVTLTLHMTDAQLDAVKSEPESKVYYYDLSTGALTDMNAVFDLAHKTATIATTHFSSFVLAVGKPAGVSYSAHVQRIGWQAAVADGENAGTSGKSLRLEALRVKLSGDVSKGDSIIYQAHVQHIGWQNAVADGAYAGTLGKSLRIEALCVTLSGLDGCSVRYRVHVQNFGWQDWAVTKNGTDIAAADYSGTQGKSLRVEAVEIEIVKF